MKEIFAYGGTYRICRAVCGGDGTVCGTDGLYYRPGSGDRRGRGTEKGHIAEKYQQAVGAVNQ